MLEGRGGGMAGEDEEGRRGVVDGGDGLEVELDERTGVCAQPLRSIVCDRSFVSIPPITCNCKTAMGVSIIKSSSSIGGRSSRYTTATAACDPPPSSSPWPSSPPC